METVENKRNESINMFSRANIVAQESKIRLVDSDEETGLDLFCYNRCFNDEDNFVKQCRGLVYHGDTLVLKAFSYTDEYSHTETQIISTLLTNFKDWTFFSAYEGALLRLFHFSGRWFLSTHRKLNAFRSKWASRESFGTLFKRALEHEVVHNENFMSRLKNVTGENILDRFQSTLDKTKQYMFLLRNGPDNRIVCSPPNQTDPLILHVGTFIGPDILTTQEEDVGLVRPEAHRFLNVEEVLDFVHTLDPSLLQGVVCFGPNNRHLKILHSQYAEMFKVRGNEPSIKFRYLQVRMDKKMVDMLYQLYPELTAIFDDYENTIYDIARVIYRAYVQRFIKKNYVIVPKEEYTVINECHLWHLADRENNRINLDRVIQVLNKQSPTNINHMIRRFKIEQTVARSTTQGNCNPPLLLRQVNK